MDKNQRNCTNLLTPRKVKVEVCLAVFKSLVMRVRVMRRNLTKQCEDHHSNVVFLWEIEKSQPLFVHLASCVNHEWNEYIVFASANSLLFKNLLLCIIGQVRFAYIVINHVITGLAAFVVFSTLFDLSLSLILCGLKLYF